MALILALALLQVWVLGHHAHSDGRLQMEVVQLHQRDRAEHPSCVPRKRGESEFLLPPCLCQLHRGRWGRQQPIVSLQLFLKACIMSLGGAFVQLRAYP